MKDTRMTGALAQFEHLPCKALGSVLSFRQKERERKEGRKEEKGVDRFQRNIIITVVFKMRNVPP